MPALNRHSMGERFMQLGPCDLVNVVTFTLTKRKVIYEIFDFIDEKLRVKKDKYRAFQKDLDLYFIIQKIEMESNGKQVVFIAACQFAIQPSVIHNWLQKICLGKIVNIRVCMVQRLFYEMSEMSYREYMMFQRLHLSCYYAKRCISNPFAHALLQKNILLITNLAQKNNFMHNLYTTYVKQGLPRCIKRPHIQDQLQMVVYGETHTHFQIYVCKKDQEVLRRMQLQRNNEDGKMEDCVTLEEEIDAQCSQREGMKAELDNYGAILMDQFRGQMDD